MHANEDDTENVPNQVKESQPHESARSLALMKLLTSLAGMSALAHMAVEMCSYFLPVVYPVLVQSMNLRYGQIGMIVFVANLATTLSQPVFGYLSDRWDARPIVVLSIVWTASIMGLMGFVRNYWVLTAWIGFGMLGSGAFHPSGAALAASGSLRQRGWAMSLFSAGGNVGAALSPLLVGVGISVFGLPGTMVVIPIGLAISYSLWPRMRTQTMISLPAQRSKNTTAKASVLSSPLVAMSLVIIIVGSRSWVHGSLVSYLPTWLQSNGWPLETAGAMLSLLVGALFLGSLSGGVLSDRIGRAPLAAFSLLLLIIAQWLMLHLSGPWQILAIAAVGTSIGGSFPVTILMAQEVWPQRMGLASAIAMGLGWIPAGIGSWVVGEIADRSSLTYALSTMIYIPLIGAAAAVLFILLFRRTENEEV